MGGDGEGALREGGRLVCGRVGLNNGRHLLTTVYRGPVTREHRAASGPSQKNRLYDLELSELKRRGALAQADSKLERSAHTTGKRLFVRTRHLQVNNEKK